ncbi:hypothetical protein [Chondromyces crocatus]|uniref:Uncharacterized protein n=1 Tax=Chondromyces crocatus TaxID=52 RepID=A0A0K1EGH5_CHOCO|nr:hypothetical protein [Chondromyces crocatus]AKT39970.1 uncharacterized protein CMC5_041230 [Chondromyces crocatus]
MPTLLPVSGSDALDSSSREQSRDPRSVRILAKTMYRELRQNGLNEQEVMALAGELLSLLATDVEDRRLGHSRPCPSDTASATTQPLVER